jgi:hypothetical protein
MSWFNVKWSFVVGESASYKLVGSSARLIEWSGSAADVSGIGVRRPIRQALSLSLLSAGVSHIRHFSASCGRSARLLWRPRACGPLFSLTMSSHIHSNWDRCAFGISAFAKVGTKPLSMPVAMETETSAAPKIAESETRGVATG